LPCPGSPAAQPQRRDDRAARQKKFRTAWRCSIDRERLRDAIRSAMSVRVSKTNAARSQRERRDLLAGRCAAVITAIGD